MTNMLCLDPNDEIMKLWASGANSTWIDKKNLNQYDESIPIAFRSMTKRKLMHSLLKDSKRDFYYIDNGYMGNSMKRKFFYRVVKNDIQHIGRFKELPGDRWRGQVSLCPWLVYHGKKVTQSGPILLVTPSGKPCQYYGIDRDTWVTETIEKIRKYTDRPIKIRDKGLRSERIKDNSIGSQCAREGIYAVVTYNSIAALEAVHYGIPAFTMAPHAGDVICSTDLSTIDNAKYPDEDLVRSFWNWIAYQQYSPIELMQGIALRLQEEHQL